MAAVDESGIRLIRSLADDAVELAATIVDRARAEIPALGRHPRAEVLPGTAAMVRHFLDAVLTGGQDEQARRSEYRAFGATRARQGIAFEDLLRGNRIATREILQALSALRRTHPISDTEHLALVHRLLDVVDVAIQHTGAAHRDVELDLARHAHDERSEFLRALLTTPIIPDLAHRAQYHGLTRETRHQVFRARPEPGTSVQDLAAALASAARTGLTTIVDGDLAGLATHLPADPVAGTIGCCDAASLADVHLAFVHASRALDTAHAFALRGCHRMEDVGILAAVANDSDLGRTLADRLLAALPPGPGSATLLLTARTYVEGAYSVDGTAAQLHVHPNTVRYRLHRFEELTGLDLHQSGVGLQVWWAAQHRRLDETAAGGGE